MSFLIKLAVLVGIVVMFIPADEAEMARARQSERSIGVFDAYGLVQATYNDLTGFCGRNPAACETGSAVADVFAAKARTGVRKIAGYLDATPAATPHEATGSIAADTMPVPRPKPASIRQAS